MESQRRKGDNEVHKDAMNTPADVLGSVNMNWNTASIFAIFSAALSTWNKFIILKNRLKYFATMFKSLVQDCWREMKRKISNNHFPFIYRYFQLKIWQKREYNEKMQNPWLCVQNSLGLWPILRTLRYCRHRKKNSRVRYTQEWRNTYPAKLMLKRCFVIIEKISCRI